MNITLVPFDDRPRKRYVPHPGYLDAAARGSDEGRINRGHLADVLSARALRDSHAHPAAGRAPVGAAPTVSKPRNSARVPESPVYRAQELYERRAAWFVTGLIAVAFFLGALIVSYAR